MSKRSERREAERLARKAAYQALREQRAQSLEILCAHSAQSVEIQQQRVVARSVAATQHELQTIPETAAAAESSAPISPEAIPTPSAPAQETPQPISEKQLIANQANAQLSTGPITAAGKSASSKNALTHGLTGKTAVLPNEDPDAYNRQLQSFIDIHKPANCEELIQVETIVDSLWRLARLRRIETGILRKGYLEFDQKKKDESTSSVPSSPEVEAYLKYEKSIRNLHIQEARLQRTIQKAQAELTRMQTIRRREEALLAAAAKPAQPTLRANATPNGFVFSSADLTLPSASSSVTSLHKNSR